jgi:hypothetical protein
MEGESSRHPSCAVSLSRSTVPRSVDRREKCPQGRIRLLGLFRPVPATFEAPEIALRRLRGLGSPGRKTRRAGHHEENEKELA